MGVNAMSKKKSEKMPEKEHVPGVGEKEQREYEHIKESAEESGRYGKRAKEVAARTVLKHHKEKGQRKVNKYPFFRFKLHLAEKYNPIFHLTLVPSFTSFSGISSTAPSTSAASTIPHDSTPKSFAGFIFAITTTCLPTSSEGSWDFAIPATIWRFWPISTSSFSSLSEPLMGSADNTFPILISSFWNSSYVISVFSSSCIFSCFFSFDIAIFILLSRIDSISLIFLSSIFVNNISGTLNSPAGISMRASSNRAL